MMRFFALALFASVILSCSSKPSVPLWDRIDIPVQHNKSYKNPFWDVDLNVKCTRPDGSPLELHGFYNGDFTWVIRCMPDQIGTWTYTARFSDGSKAIDGQFECIESDVPGMISVYDKNPMWFGFRGGDAVLLRSLHIGDRFFANEANSKYPEIVWSDSLRSVFLDWAHSQGYNMLSIASFLLNRQADGRGLGWNTPDLWDAKNALPNPAEFDRMEKVLDDLAGHRMVVFPFAGFFGKNADWPIEPEMQEKYLTYVIARLAPYWNLLFSVAGPEPLLQNTTDQYQYAMEYEDINRLGELIKKLDPYDHLLTVHNRTDASETGDRFKDKDWYQYSTIQGPKTLDRAMLAEKTLMNHRSDKPYYAQETLWAGNKYHPDYGRGDLRKNAIVLNMCAATINFADNQGNSSSGFSGSALLQDRDQEKHDIMKQVWDFMESIPFYEMRPAPELVDHGFCLANPGELYLVYFESPGTIMPALEDGFYNVEWINARDMKNRRDGGQITAGELLKSPAEGDWLCLVKKSK